MLDAFRELAAYEGAPAVTVDFPGSPDGDREHRRVQIKSLAEDLAHIEGLGGGYESWRDRVDRLTASDPTQAKVLFIASQVERAFPVAPLPKLTVQRGEVFDLTRILELMSDPRALLLCASQDRVRLLALDRDGAEEIAVDGLPASLRAIAHHTSEKLEHFHTEAAASRDVAVHAGGPSAPEEESKQLDKFAEAIGRAVDRVLANEQRPLVIAADDDLLGRLRREIVYAHLARSGIREHPEGIARDLLLAKAAAIAAESAAQECEDPFELASAESLTADLATIAEGAFQGRVACLEVNTRQGPYGSVSPDGKVALDESQSVDLVNHALRHTLINGGDVVWRGEPEEAPTSSIRAILRY